MNRIASLSLCLTLLSASASLACGFHNYAPQPTMVEQMLGSSAVVLASQSRHSPFKFEVSETLAGIVPATPIPFLVDGPTRRKLEAKQGAVLFAFDEISQSWSRLAFIDASMRPALGDILKGLPAWSSGSQKERAQHFARLLTHPNRTVRTLALRELDLVGYDTLRSLAINVDSEELLKSLKSPLERDKEPIRVLLLGLSHNSNVAQDLARGVEANALGIGPYLGAYATAWIEISGVAAVETLARQHLVVPSTTPSARRLIVEAFSLHRNFGEPEVSAAVSREMARAIQVKPELAGLAAQYFASGGSKADGPKSFAPMASPFSGNEG